MSDALPAKLSNAVGCPLEKGFLFGMGGHQSRVSL